MVLLTSQMIACAHLFFLGENYQRLLIFTAQICSRKHRKKGRKEKSGAIICGQTREKKK
jgi:hypothetical protein